ncbi:Enamine deaminase RidA, house cleaning of reactive enamine intermediates, YjgF/YER057c/UK114 family [Filomicrobium insigne]|uniref:Enamine deaminase RidA, house cleaning of reactive enamine intermediates, YjgF/YER057c/UK114 family n=1 Tax=Filomicrobium insigne TaxID=418854 RepID=A0A1H0NHR1_9HYPH|nr:RidA family protein [Filomicrobium insigne]SDO91860.1 Enamine deaminase RidA, house cleaning of reactive enamine intermediates, YjgF/YER057c/UK114 family [Filomicrobium insigne]
MVQRISSGSPFEQTFGYSRAVKDRDMIYVSGTTGYDYASMTMPDCPGEQARNALETIAKALADTGASLADVVRVVYYVTDVAHVDAVVAAVGPKFSEIRPAASMVICGLIKPEMKVEIEVTARIGAAQS